MKKINYGSFVCEVSVDPDYMLLKYGLCDYERDTIAYAVERFFRIPSSIFDVSANWISLM